MGAAACAGRAENLKFQFSVPTRFQNTKLWKKTDPSLMLTKFVVDFRFVALLQKQCFKVEN